MRPKREYYLSEGKQTFDYIIEGIHKINSDPNPKCHL